MSSLAASTESRQEEGGKQRGKEEGEEPVRQEMTGNVYEGAAHSRHSIHAYSLPQERTDMAERRKRKKLELRRSQGEERKWGRECAGELVGTQEALNKCLQLFPRRGPREHREGEAGGVRGAGRKRQRR